MHGTGGEGCVSPRPLRIWVVSPSYLPYYGGITEQVWHQSAEMAARGHRVTILTGRPLRPPRGSGHDPDPPGVRVVRLGRTVRVPSNGARACVSLGLAWRRGLEGAAEDPDVLHIHSPLEPGLPLWALHHLRGVRVGTFHTGGSRCHWGYRLLSPWLARSAARLDRRIAVSREAARYLAEHLPPADRILPNGVALERFSSAREAREARERTQARDARAWRILAVGRLDPRKGLGTLLDALARLHAEGRAIRLELVGDGPLRAALAERARRETLPVDFAGAVGRSELPGRYAAADLFVAPATDGESFGVSLLEAAASGLPIVAAGIEGYRETLAGSEAALFAAPGSSAELAGAIAQLMEDRHQRRRRAAAARDLASRFDWARLGAGLEDLYREALASRPAPPRLSRWIRISPRSVSASSTS